LRSSASSGSQCGEAPSDREAGSSSGGRGGGGDGKQEESEHGVTLKKEIGLVSACGIIVGE